MVRRRRIEDAEQIFRDMLEAQFIDSDAPRALRPVWEVFEEFVGVPFATATDGVLYDMGNGSSPQDEFLLVIVRQFQDEEPLMGDERAGMLWQLRCSFTFPASDETRSFGHGNRWCFSKPSLGSAPDSWPEFVAFVEGRPEFLALGDIPPQSFSISLS